MIVNKFLFSMSYIKRYVCVCVCKLVSRIYHWMGCGRYFNVFFELSDRTLTCCWYKFCFSSHLIHEGILWIKSIFKIWWMVVVGYIWNNNDDDNADDVVDDGDDDIVFKQHHPLWYILRELISFNLLQIIFFFANLLRWPLVS